MLNVILFFYYFRTDTFNDFEDSMKLDRIILSQQIRNLLITTRLEIFESNQNNKHQDWILILPRFSELKIRLTFCLINNQNR